jgi:hypothetical protein
MADEMTSVEAAALSDRVVDVRDLRPFLAGCCCIVSLYPSCPQNLGLSVGVSLCGGDHSVHLFKCRNLVLNENREDVLGVCYSMKGQCVRMATLCEVRLQIAILDIRMSFPWSDDVPCTVNLLGLTLCYSPPPYERAALINCLVCAALPSLMMRPTQSLKCPCVCCASFGNLELRYSEDSGGGRGGAMPAAIELPSTITHQPAEQEAQVFRVEAEFDEVVTRPPNGMGV